MKNKAVVDTNVVVSSLISKGRHTAVVEFMDMVFAKEIRPVVSKDIIKEYREVLNRPQFGFPKEVVDPVLNFFEQNAKMTDTWDTGMKLADPNDLPFFEAYIAEQSPETFLVTGNIKHYPKWPYIVTPREIVEHLV